MKNLKFVVAMLGFLAVTPTFNSCENQNHCLEVQEPQPEVAKTIVLPKAVTAEWKSPVADETVTVTFELTFKKGDEVVTKAKEGETIILSGVTSNNPDFAYPELLKVDGVAVGEDAIPYSFVLGSESPVVEATIDKAELAIINLFEDVQVDQLLVVEFFQGNDAVKEVREGEKVTLRISSSVGTTLELDYVEVDGQKVQVPYEFTVGNKAPKVRAKIKDTPAEIDLSDITAENATVTFKKGEDVVTEAKEGDKVTLDVVPEDGYAITSVKVDGEAVTVPAEITLGSTVPLVEVVVEKVVPAVDLSGVLVENTVITFKKGEDVVTEAKQGEKVTIDVTPADGYVIESSVLVDGKLATLPMEITVGETAPTVTAVAKQKKASVQFTYGVIALIGDATPLKAWGDKDYDLKKSEAEDYTWYAKGVEMGHHPNGSRNFKIRADHAWAAEWGGFTVTGTCEGVAHVKADGLGNAKLENADAEGTYDITFNTQTLKYTFTKLD